MKKKIIVLTSLLFVYIPLLACPFCNEQVRQGIYNSAFYPNLGTMMLAFIVLALIIAVLSALALKKHRYRGRRHRPPYHQAA